MRGIRIGLDCVSCGSDGLCVCSFVSLVVLCVFHLLRFAWYNVDTHTHSLDASFSHDEDTQTT